SQHDYPVRGNCPFQDATMGFPFDYGSHPSEEYRDYFPARPENDRNRLDQIMYPRGGLWEELREFGYNANYSYDLWASCRGTNIGAGLREGSNALLHPRTTRTD